MGDRKDVDLGFAQVTEKVMPNGETRTRMGLRSGLMTTITEMPLWNWNERIPWQEGHYHKGLKEHYLVLNGWMIYVTEVFPESFVPVLLGVGKLVTFHPNVKHIILLGPGAVIQTTLLGTAKGNLARKSQDWWGCEEYFKSVVRSFDCITFATALQSATK